MTVRSHSFPPSQPGWLYSNLQACPSGGHVAPVYGEATSLPRAIPVPSEAEPSVRGDGGTGPNSLREARAAEETGKTPKAQVLRLSPHPHPAPWSLPAHGCCTSCLQFPPARWLRVRLISHLWPLGWDIA